jgi:ABC-type antimicrobial peptide transport system permease subunit
MNKYSVFNLVSNIVLTFFLLLLSFFVFFSLISSIMVGIPYPPLPILLSMIGIGLLGIISSICVWVYFKDYK